MLKLLQLNCTANWGSTGKIAEGIGNRAMANGWESIIAYGRYENPSASKLIKVGNQPSVYTHYARARFLDGEGLGSRNATKRLIKQIEELNPDIIHLHNIHDHWLNYPILFDYLATIDTPIVWTFHDCWAFTGGCFYFEESNCTAWKDGCYKCSQHVGIHPDKCLRNFNLKKNLIQQFKHRLTIVCVSEWLASLVRQSYLKDCNIVVINNGIDNSIYHYVESDLRNRLHLKNKFVMMGTASVWTSRKGLYDYFTLQDVISEDYQIILVGLNKSQIKNLPKGIIGIERTTNQKELVQLYSMADLTLNLSYQETFGMTTIEGMACGTPGIVYNCTASPELITPSTGLIIEPGNINSLKEAIEIIKTNGKAFYAHNCIKRVRNCYDILKQYDKYIHLYNQQLNYKY